MVEGEAAVVTAGPAVTRATAAVAVVGVLAMLLASIATLVDVVGRWLFSLPLEGLDDLRGMAFAVVVASCFPAGLAEGHNITVRFLGKVAGRRGVAVIELFAQALTLVAFALLAWRMVAYAAEVSHAGLGTLTYQFPQAPWWWAVAALTCLCLPVQLVVVARCAALAAAPRPHGA